MSDSAEDATIQLLDLPKELLVLVVQYLDKEDRCSLRLTCKHICEIVDHPTVWKRLTVHLPRLKSFAKPVWQVLKARNLTRVSLSGITSLSKQKLATFLKTCNHLRTLHLSCNVFQHFEAFSNTYLLDLEEVCVDMDGCISNPSGSCMETLHSLPWIKKLHLKSVENGQEFALVSSHVSGLEGLEELGVRFTSLHNYLESGSLSSMLQTLPDLQHLHLDGMTLVLNSGLEASIGGQDPNNILFHHRMAKEASNPKTFFRDLCSMQQLRSLSLTLPTEACSLLMETITENLPLCSQLTILVVGLPFKPFEFDCLPPFLESFSLRWALGGMINYSRGIVTRFPEGMQSTLQHLNFPQVRLSVADLTLLSAEFLELETLSCSLGEFSSTKKLTSETKLGTAVVNLAVLPKLRHVRLWYFLASKYAAFAEELRAASDQRIVVDFSATTTS